MAAASDHPSAESPSSEPRLLRSALHGVILVLFAILSSTGCQPRPKAPALIDEPVFQSDEGFRFLVPEGWIMAARSVVPPGRVKKESLLVQYRRTTDKNQATLEVSLADLSEDTDLTAYLSAPSFTATRWDLIGTPQTLDAGGREGKRYRFGGDIHGGRIDREVTVFRRGGRVYFFTLLHSPGDTSALEQVHRAIGHLVWTR